MFHLPLRLLYSLTTLKRMPSEQTWVLAQDLIRVIFKDMDPVWLRSMWETGGSASCRHDRDPDIISFA
jgi:hypothetical protein